MYNTNIILNSIIIIAKVKFRKEPIEKLKDSKSWEDKPLSFNRKEKEYKIIKINIANLEKTINQVIF